MFVHLLSSKSLNGLYQECLGLNARDMNHAEKLEGHQWPLKVVVQTIATEGTMEEFDWITEANDRIAKVVDADIGTIVARNIAMCIVGEEALNTTAANIG